MTSHIVLASVGTDGDILPYVGLGTQLRARGHLVTLVASEHYFGLARRHDLDFRSLHSKADNDQLFGHPDFWHPIKTARLAASWGLKRIEGNYQVLREVCSGQSAVLVANPGVLAGMLIHEKQGIPWANLVLQPWMIPSVSAPALVMGLPVPRCAPASVIRLQWRFIDAVGDLLLATQFNKLRASLELPPVRQVLRRWLSPQLVIGMFPTWYARPQPDWPKQMKLAGFPRFDGTANAELPSEVMRFCKARPAPIAVTFGTEMMHAKRLFTETIGACQLLGRRAIVLTKYKHQLPDPLPGDVLHCSFASFARLFPLCAAVVHHGGIGTTAQALAAGAPQLIIPLAFDQGDNAERVKRLGMGDFIAVRRAAAARVARVLGNLLLRSPAASLLPAAVEPDGLCKAADFVEAVAQQNS